MAADQWDEQMLKICIGLPWNPNGYTRVQIMEKFDQETREKKAATTSQLRVIPPRTEATKAPKLPASAAAASSAGADAASTIAAASAADPAFGAATPKTREAVRASFGHPPDDGETSEAALREAAAGEASTGAECDGNGDDRPGAGTSSAEART